MSARNGESAASIAEDFGVDRGTIIARARELGIARERGRRDIPNLRALIALYKKGKSLNALADESGVSRPALLRRFREDGIAIRGRSEAEELKWATLKTNREAVERQCGAAWDASAGRVVGDATKRRQARTRAKTLQYVGRYERRIRRALAQLGVLAVAQRPVGAYNLDLALDKPSVAVEVQHSRSISNNGNTSLRAKRIEYLFGRGYALMVVWVKPGDSFSAMRVAKQVLAFSDLVRRDGAARRQYGVVRGDGERAATKGLDGHGWTRVPGF